MTPANSHLGYMTKTENPWQKEDWPTKFTDHGDRSHSLHQMLTPSKNATLEHDSLQHMQLTAVMFSCILFCRPHAFTALTILGSEPLTQKHVFCCAPFDNIPTPSYPEVNKNVDHMHNKQLFPNEIVFRFRKDIGSPRKPSLLRSRFLGCHATRRRLEEARSCGIFSMRCIGVWGICGHMYRLLQETHTSLSRCVRGGNVIANDPSTSNDPQIGPQIPRPERIPANGVAKNREWRGLYE